VVSDPSSSTAGVDPLDVACMLRTAARIRLRESISNRHVIDLLVDDEDMVSPDYVDLGNCNSVCEFCGAYFWFAERLKSGRVSQRLKYTGCYMGGMVN